jgi:hypothetical protein
MMPAEARTKLAFDREAHPERFMDSFEAKFSLPWDHGLG